MKIQDELRVLADKTRPDEKMQRRRAIQMLFGGASAGLALPGVAATHPVRDHLGHSPAASTKATEEAWKPLFLSSQQIETLTVLAERIIPGSSAAEVTPFIDLALSVEIPVTQEQFLRALAAFEGEALARFRSSFRDLTESQQNEILTAAANTPLTDQSKIRSGDWVSSAARGYTPPELVTLGDYLDFLKGWIAGAYYSSEIGMKELGWTGNAVYEDFPGCQHPEGHH